MRLVAIYVEDHQYLFAKPQSMNFGGKYFYSFHRDENTDEVTVDRQVNDVFIEGLFNVTTSKSKVTNLSAVVGQNGAGKSSVLNIIRRAFISHTYALPHVRSLLLIEGADGEALSVLQSDFDGVSLRYLVSDSENGPEYDKRKLKTVSTSKVQTLYYSPHFDYKYDVNFDNADEYDISFDRIVEEDLKELNDKDTRDNGGVYSASQELLFKNTLRQIEFLNSDLVQKSKIFHEIYPLQQYGNAILEIRGYKEKEREWNTPNGFRSALKSIYDRNEEELRAWAKVRDENDLNQTDVYKYIFKREVIKAILSVFYEQMEKENSYLYEGDFKSEQLRQGLESASSQQRLYLFIENARLGKGGRKILADSGLRELVEKLFSSADEITEESDISNRRITASKANAEDILLLQRKFINTFNRYYQNSIKSDGDYFYSDRYKIEGFINYMPFDKRLSSGENALLNLFSRLYHFLSTNLRDNRFRKLHEHYIILLDEADLAFHPTWKKRYVKAILQTLPFFFEELEGYPSIQVVFTTHDPLALSDLPNSNVVYLSRPNYDEKTSVVGYEDASRPARTFGANIAELLADSFFMNGALVGDFAQDIIRNTIEWLNSADKKQAERYNKIIKMIDEPIVQVKLAEMYDDKMAENLQTAVIDDQISKLQALKNKLNK